MSQSDSEQLLADLYRREPLAKFSLHAPAQVRAIEWMGESVLEWTEQKLLLQSYNGFWFFVLGAYEIVRTMSENKSCFSVDKRDDIDNIKDILSKIRMPFAKLQIQGKRKNPIDAELSIVGFSDDPPDYFFIIEENKISARFVIERSLDFFRTFSEENIIAGHHSAPRVAFRINPQD